MKKVLKIFGFIILGILLVFLMIKFPKFHKLYWIMVGIFFLGWFGYGAFLWISDMKEKRKGRASRENTQIEKLKTASFWIGVLFLSIPLWAWFFNGLGFYYEPNLPVAPYLEASLDDIIHAKSRGIDIKVFWPQHFFEIIDDEDFVPFALLFGVGCGMIIFSIFNQKWRTEESIVAVVAGVLVWIYLVINIFVGDWWWLNWCLLAIFGAALIIFGTRNLLEEC